MHSQQEEERFILEAVNGTTGRFLDIGAYHPTVFSNTRALFERGWSGVMIEPSPEPFLSLLKEYGNEPRITLVQAAVGLDRDLIEFHATADAVSTADESTFKKWQKIGGFYGSFFTAVIDLEEIFDHFGEEFDFINIDAEGVSVDILNRWQVLMVLEEAPRPRCICVEYDDRKDDAVQAANAAGYRITHDNGTNLVMVHGA